MSDMLPVGTHANSWLTMALASLDDGQDIVLVTVTATKGSSPRNHGTVSYTQLTQPTILLV